MWTVLWVIIGIGIIVLMMVVSILVVGRGHLGVEQSESHYLDEMESRSRFLWG
jgi:hypothetical protein